MLEYFLSSAKADLLPTDGGSSARSDPLVTGLSFTVSLLHSAMNSRRRFYIICYLVSNLLPHDLAKFECSNVQRWTIQDSHPIQKCAKSFILSKYLQGCHDLDHSYIYADSFTKYPPLAPTHALSRARHLSMDAPMTRCSIQRKALSQFIAPVCRQITSTTLGKTFKRK